MQKWILGKSLASNDDATLFTYGVNQSGCPIFLYLFNSEELYAYQHHHHFLGDSLPSLVELNEDQLQSDEQDGDKTETRSIVNNKKLNKNLSASLDTSLSNRIEQQNQYQQDRTLNNRLDKSLDTNLNKNKFLDKKLSAKKRQQPKEPTTLIDEMLDCKFDDELIESDLLPPPIDFQNNNFQSDNDDSKIDLLSEPLVGSLQDMPIQPINWIENKLHDNFIQDQFERKHSKSNKKDKKKTEDEQDEYESASENLLDDHSIEEDRSIEEILIEEEVYELDDKPLFDINPSTTSKSIDLTSQNYKDLIKLGNVTKLIEFKV